MRTNSKYLAMFSECPHWATGIAPSSLSVDRQKAVWRRSIEVHGPTTHASHSAELAENGVSSLDVFRADCSPDRSQSSNPRVDNYPGIEGYEGSVGAVGGVRVFGSVGDTSNGAPVRCADLFMDIATVCCD